MKYLLLIIMLAVGVGARAQMLYETSKGFMMVDVKGTDTLRILHHRIKNDTVILPTIDPDIFDTIITSHKYSFDFITTGSLRWPNYISEPLLINNRLATKEYSFDNNISVTYDSLGRIKEKVETLFDCLAPIVTTNNFFYALNNVKVIKSSKLFVAPYTMIFVQDNNKKVLSVDILTKYLNNKKQLIPTFVRNVFTYENNGEILKQIDSYEIIKGKQTLTQKQVFYRKDGVVTKSEVYKNSTLFSTQTYRYIPANTRVILNQNK